MNTKEWLKQYLPLSREVVQLEQRLETINSKLYYPQSPKWDGMPRGSGTSDPTGRVIQQKEAALELYEKKRDALTTMLREIEDAMQVLTPTERMLVRYRYMDGLAWEEICLVMGYSWTHIHRIHSAALVKLAAAEERKAQG